MGLFITRKAGLLLRYAIEEQPDQEISGFGHTNLEDGVIMMDDVYIPEQEVGGAHTDIDADRLMDFMIDLASKKQALTNWRVWWHSHAKMGVSPSNTDEDTLRVFADELLKSGGNDRNNAWAMGLVGKGRRAYHCWAEFSHPFNVRVGNVGVIFKADEDKKLRQRVQKAVEEKVHKKVSVVKENAGKPTVYKPKAEGFTKI